MAGSHDLSIYQGDVYRHVFTFQDENSVAIDLSAAEFKAQIRRRESSDVVLAEFSIDDSGAASGVIIISLSAGQTSLLPKASGKTVLKWDLEDTVAHFTYLKGDVEVIEEVTRVDA